MLRVKSFLPPLKVISRTLSTEHQSDKSSTVEKITEWSKKNTHIIIASVVVFTGALYLSSKVSTLEKELIKYKQSNISMEKRFDDNLKVAKEHYTKTIKTYDDQLNTVVKETEAMLAKELLEHLPHSEKYNAILKEQQEKAEKEKKEDKKAHN